MRLYLREIEAALRLTEAEESALLSAVAGGCARSRDRLIRSYLWLVVKVARRYPVIPTLPLEDLISEGNIGLVNAADRPALWQARPFAAVATMLIRETIYKAITDKGKLIRIPSCAMKKLRKLGDSGVRAVSLEEEGFEPWRVADTDSPTIVEAIDFKQRVQELRVALAQLSRTERLTLIKRYDLAPEDYGEA